MDAFHSEPWGTDHTDPRECCTSAQGCLRDSRCTPALRVLWNLSPWPQRKPPQRGPCQGRLPESSRHRGGEGQVRKPCPLPLTTPFPRSPAGSRAPEAVISDLPGGKGHFYTLLTAGRNGFTFSWKYLAMLKKFPPSDLEIPLTKGYPKETPKSSHRNVCTGLFMVIYNNRSAEITHGSDKKKSVTQMMMGPCDGATEINPIFAGYLMTQGNAT